MSAPILREATAPHPEGAEADARGSAPQTAQETARGAVQQVGQRAGQRAGQESAQQTARADARGSAQQTAQQVGQGAVRGSAQQTAWADARGTVQHAGQGAGQEAVRGSAPQAAQAAARGTVQQVGPEAGDQTAREPLPGRLRVLAAMSGGVDSAVAAALAVEAGHDVVGVHMALSRNRDQFRTGSRGCCSIEDASDARRAADLLGIPYYVWDLSETFEETVVADFLSEYEAGRTPNPCVRCNEHVKFEALLDKATALGFDAVATGHYARIVERPGPDGTPIRELHRSPNTEKDQSYVLAVMGRERLARAMFPLGDFASKEDVRAEAARRGLAVSSKPDSYDICFVADGDTRGFLRERLGSRPGEIVDAEGTVVGEHDGAYAYTVGQRRGLALGRPAADGRPRYVLDVRTDTNTVVVGPAELLTVDRIAGEKATWLVNPAELADRAALADQPASGEPTALADRPVLTAPASRLDGAMPVDPAALADEASSAEPTAVANRASLADRASRLDGARPVDPAALADEASSAEPTAVADRASLAVPAELADPASPAEVAALANQASLADPASLAEVTVQVRAHGAPVPARVIPTDDGAGLLVELTGATLRGVAAGQSVVVYRGTQVLGQATVARAWRHRPAAPTPSAGAGTALVPSAPHSAAGVELAPHSSADVEPAPHSSSGVEPAPHSSSGVEPAPHSSAGVEPEPLPSSGVEPAPHSSSGVEPEPHSSSCGSAATRRISSPPVDPRLEDPAPPLVPRSAQDDGGEGCVRSALDDGGEGRVRSQQDDGGEGRVRSALDDGGEGRVRSAQDDGGVGRVRSARPDGAGDARAVEAAR